jgi:hypothetical protein
MQMQAQPAWIAAGKVEPCPNSGVDSNALTLNFQFSIFNFQLSFRIFADVKLKMNIVFYIIHHGVDSGMIYNIQ